jgi:uncharacterized protein
MLGWFRAMMPKEERFFDLFDQHARTLVLGADALKGLLKGGDHIAQCTRELIQHENEADEITRNVLLAVRRSFITPFDRGDIQSLISSMDDAIDQMHKTAKTISLFEIKSFEPTMRDMADIIAQAARLTAEAVPLLRSLGKNSSRLNSLAEEITRLEERADQLYDHGRKALFLGAASSGPMTFIVSNEIYDHLEKVVDCLEDVAKEISAIVVEHA